MKQKKTNRIGETMSSKKKRRYQAYLERQKKKEQRIIFERKKREVLKNGSIEDLAKLMGIPLK